MSSGSSAKPRIRVDLSRDPEVIKYAKSLPPTMQATYLRAMSGKSRPAGVKAHCLMCVAWVRSEVRDCSSKICPLLPYRPFQEKACSP